MQLSGCAIVIMALAFMASAIFTSANVLFILYIVAAAAFFIAVAAIVVHAIIDKR